jgi:hypothetical protein
VEPIGRVRKTCTELRFLGASSKFAQEGPCSILKFISMLLRAILDVRSNHLNRDLVKRDFGTFLKWDLGLFLSGFLELFLSGKLPFASATRVNHNV